MWRDGLSSSSNRFSLHILPAEHGRRTPDGAAGQTLCISTGSLDFRDCRRRRVTIGIRGVLHRIVSSPLLSALFPLIGSFLFYRLREYKARRPGPVPPVRPLSY